MEINLIFLISVIPAIILFGIAKSGLGGSIALISIPLMTLSMSLTEALAIMLPILIFSDFIAVYRFRKDYDLLPALPLLVEDINTELQTEFFLHRNGFVDYWKGF